MRVTGKFRSCIRTAMGYGNPGSSDHELLDEAARMRHQLSQAHAIIQEYMDTFPHVAEWVKQLHKELNVPRYQRVELQAPTAPEPTPPTCPKCGSPMHELPQAIGGNRGVGCPMCWHAEPVLPLSTQLDRVQAPAIEQEISCFDGAHRFLSNFWPITVSLQGQTYPSVEHAYQASKTTNPELRAAIRHSGHPGEAKKLGKRVKLRHDWTEEFRLQTMLDLIRQKFAPTNVELWNLLDATHPLRLTEDNAWGDRFWGVCDGTGKNYLGKILMLVRDENRDRL
jgi:ribA/ribD-fused uncharacterized protein